MVPWMSHLNSLSKLGSNMNLQCLSRQLVQLEICTFWYVTGRWCWWSSGDLVGLWEQHPPQCKNSSSWYSGKQVSLPGDWLAYAGSSWQSTNAKRWHAGYKLGFRNIARACRDGVRKASAHLKFSFTRDVKGTRRTSIATLVVKVWTRKMQETVSTVMICVKATSSVWIWKTFCDTDGELQREPNDAILFLLSAVTVPGTNKPEIPTATLREFVDLLEPRSECSLPSCGQSELGIQEWSENLHDSHPGCTPCI